MKIARCPGLRYRSSESTFKRNRLRSISVLAQGLESLRLVERLPIVRTLMSVDVINTLGWNLTFLLHAP